MAESFPARGQVQTLRVADMMVLMRGCVIDNFCDSSLRQHPHSISWRLAVGGAVQGQLTEMLGLPQLCSGNKIRVDV